MGFRPPGVPNHSRVPNVLTAKYNNIPPYFVAKTLCVRLTRDRLPRSIMREMGIRGCRMRPISSPRDSKLGHCKQLTSLKTTCMQPLLLLCIDCYILLSMQNCQRKRVKIYSIFCANTESEIRGRRMWSLSGRSENNLRATPAMIVYIIQFLCKSLSEICCNDCVNTAKG